MDKNTMMENLAREAHEKCGFTGTWLYAEDGEIVSKGAVGWKDPEDKLPMQEDCLFDLGSISKQFTAAAIMLLRRRGLLSLEDEITKFFPEIPYKGVTIRHLLNHTGGLPDYMEWFVKQWKEHNEILPNAAIVRFLCECGEPAVFAPGEKWEYCNTGYCLLAQIVEEVSGVPFEDFMRDNIFEPAGMHATRIYHRRMDKVTIPNLAYGMVLPFDSDRYLLADDGPDSDYVISCDGQSGVGLVYSNILELFQWDRALRAETVLTKEEQQMMYTPCKLNNGEIGGKEEGDDGYGFGWSIGLTSELGLIVNHDGGWPGYSTWLERFVDADRVLILLQCRDTSDGKCGVAFSEGLRAIAKDKEPQPLRTIEELALQNPDRSGWASFTGKYDYDEDGFCMDEILIRDGDLYAKIRCDGSSHELKLYPMDEKTFGMKPYCRNITFGDDSLTLWGTTGKKLPESSNESEREYVHHS